jgi:hypothetical protein
MYRLSLIALAVAAIAVFSLGCGSSGTGTNASATDAATGGEITKAQFVKQAEAICAKNAKEREAALAAWEKGAGASNTLQALTEIVAPALTEEAEALRQLETPDGQQAKVAKMILNLSQGSKAIEEGTPGPEISKFQSEAATYGMKVCASL